MKIETSKNGSTLTVTMQGNLDTVTAPDLENELKKNLDGITELILDFTDVPFISSAGIRVILWAYKTLPTLERKLIVKNASTEIKEVFDLTGINSLLVFE